jgi:hypothetical protein
MKALDAESAQLAGRMTSNGPMVLFLIPLPFALNFKRQPSAAQELMEALWIAVIPAGLMTFVAMVFQAPSLLAHWPLDTWVPVLLERQF